MMYTACAWRSGEIDIVSADQVIPEGVIAFATGPRDVLDNLISMRARHSYHAENYLVPGLPEAENDDDALAALEEWVNWAFALYPEVDRVRVVS